jgi:hydroxymethylglutaryl-CoA lyase
MQDTPQLLDRLELSSTKTKLLAIVANARGAETAAQYEQISYLGYPFSVSETFQLRNTNATIEESLVRVEEIQQICARRHKTLVVYISMGFGNPYGDEWSVEEGRSVRTIKAVDSLIDVSPTTFPAYPDSDVAVAKRSFDQFRQTREAEVERRAASLAKRATFRKQANKLREYLGKHGR